MKCVWQLLLLRLLLCCVAGCGRVGYELLPDDSNAALHDAAADGAAPDEDGSAPLEDASVPEDAAMSDAASGEDASTALDASRVEDAATPEDAAGGDGASHQDAAVLGDGAAFDAAGPSDAAPSDGAASDAGPGGDDSLVLRYDFAGSGTTVADRVGARDGRLLGGAQLDGRGGVTLDGIDDFVDLPNGLISNLTSVTIVAWLEWSGGPCWQRLFDFGSSSAGEGNAGDATSALSVTAAACGENVMTALVELDGQLWAANGSTLPTGRQTQVALVVDGVAARLWLYLDGALVAQAAMPIDLAQLRDENNWLGRSQWIQDRFLRARYDELRIYTRALSAPAIADLHTRGPDLP